jgi:hypothetical protein
MGGVSDRGYPVPKRIGDAERDQAAEFLREHHAQGRLDAAEFDERVTAALNAKVQTDLDRLFTDLPSPTPRFPGKDVAPLNAPPPVPEVGIPKRVRNTIDIMVGAIWPIAILTCFIVGWGHWYLIFVPMIISSIWESKKGQDRAERERLEKQRKKQLEQERQEREGDQ